MSPAQDKYFKTLKIDKNETAKLRRALHRAYELRTFEIEHYWKRATYFWGFQVAIFAAFGLLWREISGSTGSKSDWTPVAVLLCGLGVLTALSNLLSAKGSRFWQKNWERHIDALERCVEGNLHKTIWLREGKVSLSVSRLNEALAWSIIAFWVLLFIYLEAELSGPPLSTWLKPDQHGFVGALIALALVGLGTFFLLKTRTDLIGTLPNDAGDHGSPIQVSPWTGKVSERGAPAFVLRFAPDEERAE
jgi:hypothetical protein